ncbi:MAG: hypothetical protein AVDCRST_MAG19-1418, partial [uncultured Thermomicrobiales bacterium]
GRSDGARRPRRPARRGRPRRPLRAGQPRRDHRPAPALARGAV